MRPNVSVMKLIELKEVKDLAPHRCRQCGGVMRLIGSERHPVEAQTDLLTYVCTTCDEFLVLPDASPALGQNQRVPGSRCGRA